MKLDIRRYSPSDFQRLVEVYQSAFAEPPWDEYMRCNFCGINYGVLESQQSTENCKKCESPLQLVPFWSVEDIRADLDFASSQPAATGLVAEVDKKLIGFIWGYRLPFNKFPFLREKVSNDAIYVDDIAVRGDCRLKGIGKSLCVSFLSEVFSPAINSSESVLRTDRRNVASMGLFSSVGFKEIGITDPKFPFRVYLAKRR
jgi:ribosomal protein S18 acetylase RimI-like enzyme